MPNVLLLHDAWVDCAGHGDSRWLQAVQEQAATLTHTSNLFHTVPAVRTGPSPCLSACLTVERMPARLRMALPPLDTAFASRRLPQQSSGLSSDCHCDPNFHLCLLL